MLNWFLAALFASLAFFFIWVIASGTLVTGIGGALITLALGVGAAIITVFNVNAARDKAYRRRRDAAEAAAGKKATLTAEQAGTVRRPFEDRTTPRR